MGVEALRARYALFEAVLGFFEGDADKAFLWFTLPNPMLGSVRPLDMLLLGRGEKLERFVRRQLEENTRCPQLCPRLFSHSGGGQQDEKG